MSVIFQIKSEYRVSQMSFVKVRSDGILTSEKKQGEFGKLKASSAYHSRKWTKISKI